MTRSGDWRGRADAVRGLPLETILLQRGAKQDPRDKAKWHTERGVLSVTESKFTNWSCQIGGGGAIDLVMHLANIDFREAVAWLEQQFAASLTGLADGPPTADRSSLVRRQLAPASATLTNRNATTNILRQLSLPVADPSQLNRVYRYLTQRRCLPESSLEPLIAIGKLYADHRGNAVFLLVAGKANRPIGAELRGSGPQVWRGLAPGTDKNAGFFWTGEAGSRTIILCESAIDAISCREFFPACIAISTSGARPAPRWLIGLIACRYTIHCGYDTDEAGERAAASMIAMHPSVKRLQPSAHDWNDALVAHRTNSQ